MDLYSLADKYADTYQVPRQVFRNLIQKESGWNANAQNPDTGAYGLTQVLNSTAQDPGFGVAPLKSQSDPEEQIRFGAQYLRAMADHYGGDYSKAAAAYNWGAGNVDKHGMDNLPAETRDYVDFITGPGEQTSGGHNSVHVSTSNGPAGGPSASGNPQTYADTGLFAKLLPDVSDQQRRDMLLSIGAGLLSGKDLADGLGLAAKGILGVKGDYRDQAQQQYKNEYQQYHDQMEWGIDKQRLAQAKARPHDYATPFQIKGVDPKSGQEIVRMATMVDGVPNVYGDDGKLIPAPTIMHNITMAGRNEAQDVANGAGGIPNAISMSADGSPSFKFQRESEGQAYSWATRAIHATQDLDQITKMIGPDQMTSIEGGLRRWASQNAGNRISAATINSVINDSGVQGAAASAMSQYLQAVLRADTGAAYTGVEIGDYGGAFLPNTGDDPQLVAYKKATRDREISSLIARTGSAAPYLNGVTSGQYKLPGKSFSDVYSQPAPTGALSSANVNQGSAFSDPETIDPEVWSKIQAQGITKQGFSKLSPEEQQELFEIYMNQ